ncbi:WSC domain-containing protein [Gymnopilus junonius]|uniref:WSC domain-containing protein n=1 Tax=Gymnopilus junonius TaxID=109634 RepID=A0A9P5NL70_GYMJU|nr:WSC domain-containing protein [Gymnopilus junonius]
MLPLLGLTTALLIVSGSVLASAIPPTRRSESSFPIGWTSIGCYSDSSASRTLRIAAYTDVNAMTIESCITFCASGGYLYAGVEYSRECYCDNVIEAPGARIDDGICNMPCVGNTTETCGGAGGMSVFQDTALPPPPPPPPIPVIKQTVGDFRYVGCFKDGVDGAARTLQTQLDIQGVSAEICTAACKAAGFILAGLEYGQECWCDSYMPLVLPAPDSDCNLACNSDNKELCGAGNRLTVYQDTTAQPLNAQVCLTTTQLHSSNEAFAFNLQAVPVTGGAPQIVGNYELTASAGQPTYFQLSMAPVDREAHSFTLSGNVLQPDDFEGEGIPIPIEPEVGGVQWFAAWSTFTPYNKYCAKPNPISSFGIFFGPPILSVNNHADLWALCPQVPDGEVLIYSPPTPSLTSNTSDCQAIVLEMTQYNRTF